MTQLVPGWLRWRGIPVLLMLATWGLTLFVWQGERTRVQLQERQSFEAAARETRERIQRRLLAHERLLQGVQGLLVAYPAADDAALRRYAGVLNFDGDYAGLQGIVLVRADPAGPARIAQIEPALPRHAPVLGRDLLAQPQAKQALLQAQDSGRLALSPALDLQQLGLAPQQGTLMVLPVYASTSIPADRAARRAELRGWVLAPLALPELMASLRSELPAGLGLSLHDGLQTDEQSLLYRSTAHAGSPLVQPQAHPQQVQEQLSLGGHSWTLLLNAGPGFAPRAGGFDDANLLLGGGLLLGLLLAQLAWLMGSARERAHGMAERMTRALRESEQRWAVALEGAGDGIWDWRLPSGLISTSARWKVLMGMPAEMDDTDMAQWRARIHPEDQARAQDELQRCLDGFVPNVASEYRVAGITRALGGESWNWVLMRGTVIERDAQKKPVRMIGTLSDINARRQSEERVRFMALHDPLTELANRAHFTERMHFALANARRYKENLGLILLDLDRFKPINDQYGHGVGDQLLQAVARRIKSSVRETDTVGRIGGDEFVVLLTGPVTRETARLVADKIFNQVALPMELSGARVEITCSLGLSLYPEDGQDELTLTKAADDAMYRNKRAGRHVMTGASPVLNTASPLELPPRRGDVTGR